MKNRNLQRASVATVLALSAAAAWAHHGEGMQVPNTFASGLIGGFAHPVLAELTYSNG